jgi:hypothetical protein
MSLLLATVTEWTLKNPGVEDSEDILKRKGFKIQKHGVHKSYSDGNHFYLKSTEFGHNSSSTSWSHYHQGNPVGKFDNDEDLKAHIKKTHGESTTSVNFDIQPSTWTTAQPGQPLQWFTQEGRACTIGGKPGVLKRVGEKMVCDTSNSGEIVSAGVGEGVVPDMSMSDPEVSKLKGLGRDKVHKVLFNRDYRATSYGPRSGDLFQRSFKHPLGHRIDVHFDKDDVARKALGVPHRESKDTMDTIQEAVTLRFSSPSRAQIAKQAVYWDIHRRIKSGLGKIRVGKVLGAPGAWYFDVGSDTANQFLDPSRMTNILVSGVTVSRSSVEPEGAVHLASQSKSNNVIKEKIRNMVDKKLGLVKEAGTYHVFDPENNHLGRHFDKKAAMDHVRELGPGHTVGYEDNGAPLGFIGHMYDHEGHEMHWSRHRSTWVKGSGDQ